MKRLQWCAVLIVGTALCGCAGREGRLVKRDLPAEVDEGKVLAVNDWAVHRGAVVRWINLPTRRVPSGGGH